MYNSVTHFINIAVPPWTFFFSSNHLRLAKYVELCLVDHILRHMECSWGWVTEREEPQLTGE